MPAGVSALTPLANLTLSSTAASVTFSSIVGTYRDLRLVMVAGTSGAGGGSLQYTLNNDSSSTYLWTTLEGNGSAVSSAWNGNNYVVAANNYAIFGYDSTPRTIVSLEILDYSATDKHKTILSSGRADDRAANSIIVRWPSTAAVGTISLSAAGGTFLTGSTFALYGVSA
jgi:hypothetical protein